MKLFRSRLPIVLAATAILTVGGWYSQAEPPAHALTLVDTGGQYGWSSPWAVSNTESTFVKTSGRCGNGHNGQMFLKNSGGDVIAGPVSVPAEWKFSQNIGFTFSAGMAAGDYEFYVDCGDLYEIHIAELVTNGGAAQFVDYIEGVINPTPVTAAPQGGSDPIVVSGGNGYGDAPVGVEEGGSAPKTSAPRVTRTKLPRSKSTVTTQPPAPTPDTTPTTVVPPAEVQHIGPTDVSKEAPKQVALELRPKDQPFPLAPLGAGAVGAALVGTAGVVRSQRRRAKALVSAS